MSETLTLERIRNFEGKYPKQLWYLFTVEMWERFCFYGMRGVLTIFMAGQLGLLDKEANLKYGAIQAFVYAFTFIGGIFADKILGFKRSLVFGAFGGNVTLTLFIPAIAVTLVSSTRPRPRSLCTRWKRA